MTDQSQFRAWKSLTGMFFDIAGQLDDKPFLWAKEGGKYGLARELDRKGNRIDRRLDREGERINRRLDHKGRRIVRHSNHKAQRIRNR